MKANIWFAGTPFFAVNGLKALIDNPNHHVTNVFTQPDRPKGRGRSLTESPVKTLAKQNNINILQPEKLNQAILDNLDRPDLAVVAAYGMLLPEWFLNFPKLGCINIHASLLPRWRGASPIQQAILANDLETGISIMQMDKGLDTGAIWLKKSIKITNQTAGELTNQLAELGADALLEILPVIFAQKQQPIKQDNNLASYAHKISKQQAKIDWQQDAKTINRQIRAYNPFIGAFTFLADQLDSPIKIHQAIAHDDLHKKNSGLIINHDQKGIWVACKKGILQIEQLQLAGKKAVTASQLKNSLNLTGKIFQ